MLGMGRHRMSTVAAVPPAIDVAVLELATLTKHRRLHLL